MRGCTCASTSPLKSPNSMQLCDSVTALSLLGCATLRSLAISAAVRTRRLSGAICCAVRCGSRPDSGVNPSSPCCHA